MEIKGYRGGSIRPDADAVYIAIGAGAESLAEDYAGGGPVFQVTYTARQPLVLESGEQVQALWQDSGALQSDGPFYAAEGPCSQRQLNTWVRDQGYDALVVTEAAFEGEAGYVWAAGTFGEPQAALFDQTQIKEGKS